MKVSALLRHRPGLPVLVRGDRNVSYGDIVVLMSLLQRAGVPSVGLMTEPGLLRTATQYAVRRGLERMAQGVSFRRIFDNTSCAAARDALVHVVLLGVLLVSLDWRPRA